MSILLPCGLDGHVSARTGQRRRRQKLQDADKGDQRSKQIHSAVSGSGDLNSIITKMTNVLQCVTSCRSFFPKETSQTNQVPQMSAGKTAIMQGAMLENEDEPLFDLE